MGKTTSFYRGVLGFIEYTDNAIYMKSENFIILDKEKFQILDFDGKDTKYEITKILKEFGDVYKGDYVYFTLKEIYEQPNTILRSGEKIIDAIIKTADYIKHAKNIHITCSGTSYNSALIANKFYQNMSK